MAGTCSAWRREGNMDLTAVYSCLVGGDGKEVVEHNSAQRKDGKQQGDNRAGDILPAHKKKKIDHKIGEDLQ